MDALSEVLAIPESEKATRGLTHTPAEIAQQPATWESTAALFRRRRSEIKDFLSSVGVGSKSRVFLVGAGTSDYVGQSLAYLLRRKWKCEVVVVPSTDLLTHMDQLIIPGDRHLWISFSRSGDSPEGVAVLKNALNNHPDVRHLIVCCNANGRMVKDIAGRSQGLSICLDDAVNDRGLAMTSSFSNMVVFGQCLAHADDLDEYEEILQRLVRAGKSFLPIAADGAAELAKGSFTKACFVGSGPLKAVARESALKLLELTAGKILTMSESALGLRHGPMAALDKETLFVCFLSGDRRIQRYEKDLLEEIGNKRLVRSRIVVAGDDACGRTAFGEGCLAPAVPFAAPDDYRPPLDAILGQLLGLFFSLRWNLQPDCPSPNGAISRVVQNVSIHA